MMCGRRREPCCDSLERRSQSERPLADHLWQSTLFAGVVWLLTLALRKNRARVRHGLWLAASCKFLVPFSLFIALGSLVPSRTAPVTTASDMVVVMDQVSQPFTTPRSPQLQCCRPQTDSRQFYSVYGSSASLESPLPGRFAGVTSGLPFAPARP